MVLQTLSKSSRDARHLSYRTYDILENAKAQKICQTALDGQVTPEVADEELVYPEKGVEDPEPASDTRVYQVLHGPGQKGHSWKQLLQKVCADECRDLLKRLRSQLYEISEVSASETAKSKVVAEVCAETVVQKVEAEVLTCCGEECGWDGQRCRLWPFMDATEQEGWDLRCCTEGTVLKGSSRERLCNSVQPKEKQKTLMNIDPKPRTKLDARRVGQDLQQGSSLLQDVSLTFQPVCDAASGLQCQDKDARAHFLDLCKLHAEKWQFLEAGPHSDLGHYWSVKPGINIRSCHAELGKVGVGSVSWLNNNCYVIMVSKEDDDVKAIYADAKNDTGGDFEVIGAALFKRALRK